MPVEHDLQHMWQLAADRRSVRLSWPGLPVAGLAEPIRVNIDFETGVVDQIIERLTVRRALQPANNSTTCDARSSPMQAHVCVTGSPTRHARPSRTMMACKSPLDHRLQQAEDLVGRTEEVFQRQMIAARMFLRQLEARHARQSATAIDCSSSWRNVDRLERRSRGRLAVRTSSSQAR